jgi:hypothetical protein
MTQTNLQITWTSLGEKMSTNRQIIKGLQDIVKDVPGQAYDYFVAETPIRSGNARRNTRIRNTTIKADYAYAGRLDEGWSSQSPAGMSDPTLTYIDNLITRNARKF